MTKQDNIKRWAAQKNKQTVGLHCKACDAPLSDVGFDGELCPECLSVVHDLNKDIYGLKDKHPCECEADDAK